MSQPSASVWLTTYFLPTLWAVALLHAAWLISRLYTETARHKRAIERLDGSDGRDAVVTAAIDWHRDGKNSKQRLHAAVDAYQQGRPAMPTDPYKVIYPDYVTKPLTLCHDMNCTGDCGGVYCKHKGEHA